MLTHSCIFLFWEGSLLFNFFDTLDWDTVLLLRGMLSRLSKHLGVVIGRGRNMWSGRDLRRFLVVHGRCSVFHFMVHNRCRCNHRLVVNHSRCHRKTVGNWHHGRVHAVGRRMHTVGRRMHTVRRRVHAVGNRHHWRVHGLTLGTLLMGILLIGMWSRMVKWVQLCVLEAVAIGESWMVGVRFLVVE